jgi:hypothetical protein
MLYFLAMQYPQEKKIATQPIIINTSYDIFVVPGMKLLIISLL